MTKVRVFKDRSRRPVSRVAGARDRGRIGPAGDCRAALDRGHANGLAAGFAVLGFALRGLAAPEVHRTPVDYALLGFFILTGVSALLSYEPMVSIGKLRAATLFTIVYLFAENIRSRRWLRALAILLVASCMINVVYTFGQYAFGRGVKVYEVRPDSPLSAARWVTRKQNEALPIFTGDTLLEIDGRPLRSVEQLALELDASPQAAPAKIKIYRVEWMPVVEVPRGRLLPGNTAEATSRHSALDARTRLARRRLLRSLHDVCRSAATNRVAGLGLLSPCHAKAIATARCWHWQSSACAARYCSQSRVRRGLRSWFRQL